MNKEFESLQESTSEQFSELFERIVSIRLKLIHPENVSKFKQQVIGSLQKSNLGSAEDYSYFVRIFVFLANREKPPTMGEISSELNTSFSSATRIIDWLVQSDIVERVSDPNDRRIVRICMSAIGREFYQTYLDSNKKRIEQILSHFSPEEQSQLFKLSSKFLDLLVSDKEE